MEAPVVRRPAAQVPLPREPMRIASLVVTPVVGVMLMSKKCCLCKAPIAWLRSAGPRAQHSADQQGPLLQHVTARILHLLPKALPHHKVNAKGLPAAATSRFRLGNRNVAVVFPDQYVEPRSLQLRLGFLGGAQEADVRCVGPIHRVVQRATRTLRDVLDREPTAALQDTAQLRIPTWPVSDVHGDVLGPRQIE